MRKKILIIVNSLQKAGAEKYAFELARNLNSEIYDIEILTTDDVLKNREWPHFYYFKLKERNFKIHTILHPKISNISGLRWLSRYKVSRRITNLVNNLYKKQQYERHSLRLSKLLAEFDALLLIDAPIKHYIKDSLPENVYFETHLMCHQSQFPDSFKIYSKFEPGKKYNFVYIDPLQILEAREHGLQIGKTFYMPLSMDLPVKKLPVEHKTQSRLYKIGIFSRISYNKPLENILGAFSKLKEKFSNVELHIFGFIQDDNYYQKLLALIKSLNIEDAVVFEGHSDDMWGSIIDKKIDLVWVISIYNFIGYAALELSLNGIPIILNNIAVSDLTKKKSTSYDMPLPYFYDAEALADFTAKLIVSGKLAVLAEAQYAFHTTRHDIKKNIKVYENFLEDNIKEFYSAQ